METGEDRPEGAQVERSAEHQGVTDGTPAGPGRGLPERVKRARICRSIRRLARADAGQGKALAV